MDETSKCLAIFPNDRFPVTPTTLFRIGCTMSRNNLAKPFRKLPRWLLVAMEIVIGFPFHLVAGAVMGVAEGLGTFWSELSEVWNIDN